MPRIGKRCRTSCSIWKSDLRPASRVERTRAAACLDDEREGLGPALSRGEPARAAVSLTGLLRQSHDEELALLAVSVIHLVTA